MIFAMIRRTVETRAAELALTIFLSCILPPGVSPTGKCVTGKYEWIGSEVSRQFNQSASQKEVSVVTKEDQHAIFLAPTAGRAMKFASQMT
jgi:hypothetical protein